MPYTKLEDFGPYTILRPIAKGGMAELYLARQRGLEGVERVVVLKRILEKHAHDEEFVTMFLDEARLLAALSHPNIAQVFEVGQVAGSYYLAMEYVRGPTLGRLMGATRDSGGVPRREALGVGLAIAEALHYVHERRDEVGRPLDIVHRDLNPANVLVSYDGAVKLIDFGIAKAATKVYETRTGVIKGTYGYIAPEQLVGNTPVDRRADVFALGILLYELCVGQHPYDASDEPNLIDRILQARYRRPREVRPDVPRDLDRLIAACLAPQPEGRPEHLGEVIEALARHLGEQGIVPTMSGLAQLARAAVPDDEGPRPVRPLTAQKRLRPFGVEPTGTRRLSLEGVEPARAGGDITRVSRPPAAPSWSEPPTLPAGALGDDEPLTVAGGPPTDVELAADDESAQTLARAFDLTPPDVPAHDAVGDEAPTRLMSLTDPVMQRGRDLPPAPATTTTPEAGAPRLAWIGVGAVAVLAAVGLGVVYAFKVLGGAPTVAEVPVATDATSPAGAAEIEVTSDPPGATVRVDGQRAEGVTPLVVGFEGDVAPGREVWLRVTLDGYAPEERRVRVGSGAVRFVLSRVPAPAP